MAEVLSGDLTTRSSCFLGLDGSGHSHTPMIVAEVQARQGWVDGAPDGAPDVVLLSCIPHFTLPWGNS